MGRYSRDKGYRGERTVVLQALRYGIEARRVPMSGALRGLPDDVILKLPEPIGEIRGEVKVRGDGFANLYHWIADVPVLFVKRDRGEVLVVLRASTFYEYLGLHETVPEIGEDDAA